MVAVVQRDAPWIFGHFPKSGGSYQQWVGNAKPTQMVRNTLPYLRLDASLRAQKQAEWNTPVRWPLALIPVLLALAVWPAWRSLRRRERMTVVDVMASPLPQPLSRKRAKMVDSPLPRPLSPRERGATAAENNPPLPPAGEGPGERVL